MNPLRSSVQILAGLLGLWLVAAASAQEPMIRAKLQAPAQVWTGQKVTLVVDLLAPGYFASAATFDLPDPAGVLILPPSSHPIVGGETVGETYYTRQTHELSVYPARAGDLKLPPIHVRFSFKRAPLDHDDVTAEVVTPQLTLRVATPPGAENLGQVISARNLRVVESWNPEPGKATVHAGDAFTRTVTFRAPDIPGMIFPLFPTGDVDGLRLYPKAQVMLDSTERGVLSGGRRDTIVYVCERPGKFVIPAVRLTWWDLDAKKLRTVDLPERTIDVIANPGTASSSAKIQPAAQRSWSVGRIAAGAIIGLGALVLLLNRRVHRAVATWLAPLRPVHLAPLNPGFGDEP